MNLLEIPPKITPPKWLKSAVTMKTTWLILDNVICYKGLHYQDFIDALNRSGYNFVRECLYYFDIDNIVNCICPKLVIETVKQSCSMLLFSETTPIVLRTVLEMTDDIDHAINLSLSKNNHSIFTWGTKPDLLPNLTKLVDSMDVIIPIARGYYMYFTTEMILNLEHHDLLTFWLEIFKRKCPNFYDRMVWVPPMRNHLELYIDMPTVLLDMIISYTSLQLCPKNEMIQFLLSLPQ